MGPSIHGDGHATPIRIPPRVWVLGGVSLLMNVSSEMIHSLLPLCATLGLARRLHG